jgi:uncharacterized membrane protein
MTELTRPRRTVLGLVVITAGCAVVAVLTANSVIDTIVGLPFFLYLPGAALVWAVDPHGRRVSGWQRLVWSIGASIGLVILGGLALNLIGGLTRPHWLVLVAAVVVVLAVVAWVRGSPLPPGEAAGSGFEPSSEASAEEGRIRSISVRQGALLVGALAVVAGSLVLSLHSGAVTSREHFVQAWILPRPQANPWSTTAQTGITNHEGASRTFVVLEAVGKATATQQVVVTQQVVALGDGQTWVHKLTRKPGQTVRVTVALSSRPDQVLVSVNLARPVS